MRRSWLFPGLLLTALSVLSLGQQAEEKPSDQERLVQLEKHVVDIQRLLVALSGDGAVEVTPATLELRLSRIERRLERLEQKSIGAASSLGPTSDRMMENRLRTLENAVMRLQQQR